jgi:16S rRNA (cytosine967-C5)-methyltransferase
MLKNFSNDFVVEFFEAELTNLTHIRVNTLKIKYADFVSKLKELDIDYTTSTLDDALFVEYSKIVREESLNGLYTPQGIPSMIVSRNVVGNTILDACSAPGGKAVYIASLNPDSKVIACDYYEHRAQLINDYSSRMGVKNVTSKVLDATNFVPEFEGKFDCVLLDVPCSGLGVIDKKPDLLINNDLDFLSLPDLQYKILENNSKYVKSGGSIVYSTCTILPTENEDIITKFLQKHPNFMLDTVDTFGVLCDDKSGLKTFYPHISKTEGFFIGKLVRND